MMQLRTLSSYFRFLCVHNDTNKGESIDVNVSSIQKEVE